MQIFHRYTGFIFMSIFLVVVLTVWFWYDSTLYYFEKQTCPQITEFGKTDGHLDMTLDEHTRFHIVLQGCFDSIQFVGDKKH